MRQVYKPLGGKIASETIVRCFMKWQKKCEEMMNAGYVINFYGINGTPANPPKFSGWVCQIQYPPPDFDGEAANEKGVTMREAFLKALAHLTKRAADSPKAGEKSAVRRVRKSKVTRPAKSG